MSKELGGSVDVSEEFLEELRKCKEDKVMSLDGGLLNVNGDRYNGGKAPLGRKVVYLNKNGLDGGREYANKILKEGQVLEVKEIYVGRSSSTVEFGAMPDEFFNTVMFADVEEG